MKTICIAGTIGKDAVLRRTQGGEPILGVSVAVDDGYGENKQTIWFDVAVWGKRGQALEPHLKKGTKVTVSGDFGTRQHENRTFFTCRANDITIQGGGGDRPAKQSKHQEPERDSYGNAPATTYDDEIPFWERAMTVNRIVETEHDRKMLLRFIESRKLPFTVTLTDGKHRTTHQNRLQRQWVTEIAAQLGDQTPEEVRGYCKLAFGVPILRADNEAFRIRYDLIIRPLGYAQKLALMMEPFDFGVTRIMTTRQKTAYLDAVHRHFSAQGIVLTDPSALGRAA